MRTHFYQFKRLAGRIGCGMKRLKALLFPMGALVALLASGCVYVGSDAHSDSSWPKPVAVKDFRQFEGVYRNDSLQAKRDKDWAPAELFDFLTGEGHSHGDSGKRVELRSAPDGSLLRVRLLDQENREIDSAILPRGTAFVFTNGALVLYGPFSGRRSDTSNFGPYTQHERDKLRMASTGGLLGHESEYEVGLLFDVIPEASRSGSSMFWPKLAK
jgi:hypothetical protein